MSKESSKEAFVLVLRAGTEDEWITAELTAADAADLANDSDNSPVIAYKANLVAEVSFKRTTKIVVTEVKKVGK